MVALIRFCILLAVSSIRAEEEAIDEISIKPEESWPRLASSSSSSSLGNEQAQSSNDTLASDSEGNKMKRKRKKLRYILKKLAWYFSPISIFFRNQVAKRDFAEDNLLSESNYFDRQWFRPSEKGWIAVPDPWTKQLHRLHQVENTAVVAFKNLERF